MKSRLEVLWPTCAVLACAFIAAAPARAELSAEELAKLAQNPVGNLISDWKADSGQQWTVPLGGGVGKIFHFGKLPVNTQISAYYNVIRPDFGANWQIRAQVQLMFPK
jgi:hypothetical protein